MAGCRVVYFSSVSENTHRFVGKLGVPAVRIPLHGRIEVDEPYVLVLPTYGGGHATPDINDGGYVPKQVIAFLNNEHNRSLIRGVIAAGNNNFGAEFAYAGDVVSGKCGVCNVTTSDCVNSASSVTSSTPSSLAASSAPCLQLTK